LIRISGFLYTLLFLWIIFFAAVSSAEQKRGGLLEQSKSVVGDRKAENKKWVAEKTGQYLPLDIEFSDSKGEVLTLEQIINTPVILLPIYFYCPNICSKSLSNLAIALPSLSGRPGKDYRVIAISFNEVETPEVAARAKKNYLKIAGADFPEEEWKFLTGSKEAIARLTDALGYRYKKLDDETFIHAAALMIIAADGKIIRYVYGSFLAGDIDMGLAGAATGSPSLSVRRFLDFCFNYDPNANKSVFQQVKIGVLLLFVLVVGFVLFYFKRK
jgi:protein SCO1/2